ncbi:hypothetical protein DN069_35065 [Streptacidiphilus pinicola]|uniref:Lipoprotein n=1 Tax=Streptacidiphilus pinicola TaxID=2219663 RepID=A0A2X0ITX8_9ACTN|nr:hypothetical protein DN069_35065 [Streptacidiphilus pinicola]
MVAVGGLVAVGCSAAAAAPHPAAAAHGDRTVRMVAYANNDGPTASVVVTGAVGDYGQAVSVYPDGSIDPEHNSQLSLKLSHGSFRLDTGALDKAFVAAMASEFPSDKTTCSGHVAVTQRVSVVPGSGTGAYRGIGGAFTLTVALDEVDAVSAAQPCTGGAAFLSQVILISGQGSVSLG